MKIIIGIMILNITVGCGIVPDYSIVINKDTVARKKGTEVTGPGSYISILENPIITGQISTAAMTFTTNSTTGYIEACCSRSMMTTSGEYFLDLTSTGTAYRTAFLGITQQSAIGRESEKVYQFRMPPLALPSDGSTIPLNLMVNEELKLTCNVRLDPDVIVLPVYVHVFKRTSGRLDPRLGITPVRSWFDLPSLNTQAVSTGSTITPGVIETHLQTKDFGDVSFYSPVDTIWKQAKIQFKLAGYEVIENDALERQIISEFPRAFEPSAIHATKSSIPGIHIYIGRNERNFGSGGFSIISGSTRGPGCTGSANSNNAIALAFDEEGRSTLAHEIGHYLGLDHVDGEFRLSCGALLLDAGDDGTGNLMRSVPSGHVRLSPGQITKARQLACAYMQLWGLTTTAHCE